ncbi:MAG TPA: Gfo/Idh/MocA family oxidoreductase [Gaiellaceae bacterium]|jgi:hypothetical protein
MSDGNGHPYSWSAILNGYDPEAMASCPFPAIPAYLAERQFPRDRLDGARVTHVWTQDRAVSAHIARASLIDQIVSDPVEMLGHVDGILLARDDAQSHRALAAPFLAAGLPVYVDKPLATTVAETHALLELARDPAQIFSCSALRYAPELSLGSELRDRIGAVEEIEARSPKEWATYAVHAIEPVISWLPDAEVEVTEGSRDGPATSVRATIGRVRARFMTTGTSDGEIEIEVRGASGSARLVFEDSFTAFKSALAAFLMQARTGIEQIPRRQTLAIVSLIEAGTRA